MLAEKSLFILSGLACLGLFCFAIYTLVPRDGKPQSALISTEARSTFVTLALLVFLVFGIGLFVKGIFV
jgi:hypothetical protein